METVWTTEGKVKILLPSGEEREVEEELQADELKSIVQGAGLRKFVVKQNGETLSASDFPITEGEVVIEEYNEAK